MIVALLAASIVSYNPWGIKKYDCSLVRPNGKPFRIVAFLYGKDAESRYGQVTSFSAPFPSIKKRKVLVKKNREIVEAESVTFIRDATILSYEFDYTHNENGFFPVKVLYMNLGLATITDPGIRVSVGFCKESYSQ